MLCVNGPLGDSCVGNICNIVPQLMLFVKLWPLPWRISKQMSTNNHSTCIHADVSFEKLKSKFSIVCLWFHLGERLFRWIVRRIPGRRQEDHSRVSLTENGTIL